MTIMLLSEGDSDCSALTELSSELSSPPLSPRLSLDALTYPTPASSQTQSNYSSSSEGDSRKRRHKHDETTIAKRRKHNERAQMRPIHVNLRSGSAVSADDKAFEEDTLLKILRKKRKIIVVAGAGISTSAGVPDFRSSNGLFNTLRNDNKIKGSGKQLFDASVYQTDSSTSSFHDMVRTLSKVVDGAKPTPFHHMLATLAQEGRLMRLYTQNVDGIDTSLPPLATEIPLPRKGPFPKTVQLHGSLKKMVCVKCRDLRDFDPELFDGPHPPQCASCVDMDKVRTEEAGKRSHGIGKLRPRMVLYNEQNPDDEAIGGIVAADLRARPDAIIVVGTSMEIPGVKRIVREMCATIRARKDGKCVWVNRGPPPIAKEFEDCWDVVVAGDCDRVATLADMRKWDEEPREGSRVTDSDAERAREGDVKVLLQSPKKEKSRKKTPPPTLLTPESSPVPKSEITAAPVFGLQLLAKKQKSTTLDPKAVKPKRSYKPRAPKPKTGLPIPATQRINTTFKLTKPNRLSVAERKGNADPHQPSKALEIIHPHSVKTNSNPVSPDTGSLDGKKETLEMSPSSPGRLRQMSEEIITPEKIPKGMAQILS